MAEQEYAPIHTIEKINADFLKHVPNTKLGMPLIRLYHGPYACNGFIRHREQKLHGLVECLKNLKYDVELIPSAHLNRLEVVILGYEVHRVNVKFLQFNIDCDYDTICTRTLKKIEEATSRLYNSQNIAKMRSLLEKSTNLSTESIKIAFSEEDGED